MDHPGIMTVEPTVLDDGSPAYYMPIADRSLANLVKQHPTGQPADSALSIMLKILDALQHIHERDVVHRDLNPGNILFIGGEPVISDFGLTRDLSSDSATMTQMMAGTHGYMAPEQLDDPHAATPQMDVFAAGIVLHQLLSGERPQAGVVSPRIQGELRNIVYKATSRTPGNRFAKADEFAGALGDYLAGDDDLMAVSERIDTLINTSGKSWKQWHGEVLANVAANMDDSDLILRVVPKVPQAVWEHWSDTAPEFLEDLARSLVDHLDELERVDSFDEVDPPATLVAALWPVLPEDGLRLSLLRPLAELGVRFHRYFVGETFANLTGPLLSNPVYAREVLAILRSTRDFPELVGPYLENYTLPPAIKRELP